MESKAIKTFIKFVALYIRKSRGDIDKDLEKHKRVLIDMCSENGWKYVMFEEIETGDSIEMRPVMQILLKKVEEGTFDGVCVVEYDRLSRGDLGDQDKIKKAFVRSNTLIITSSEIYNLQDDNDDFVTDMKGFIARREYKQIVKRLAQGKKVGAMLGQWTNGVPPYPYEYQRYSDNSNEKGLVINEEKLLIYRRIIDLILIEKKTTSEIAWYLNKEKIPSPKGKTWCNVTVNRLLKDETHLGKIVTNKTIGDGHKKKKTDAKVYKVIPKSEWMIVENCHRPVKTQVEHDRISIIINERSTLIKRSVAKKLTLTGMIKCAKCGHTMMLFKRGNYVILKPCWYRDHYGNKCVNGGCEVTRIYKYIESRLDMFEGELIDKLTNNQDNDDRTKVLKAEIESKKKGLIKLENALERVMDAYEAGTYTHSQFAKRKSRLDNDLEILNEEINIAVLKTKYNEKIDNTERLLRIKGFRERMKNRDQLNDEELNEAYKSIIQHILWIKEKNERVMNIVFK